MILTKILKYIEGEINHSVGPSAEKFAQLGNISQLENASGASNADLRGKVILTIVNIEEEKTLKNSPHYIRDGEAILKRNPTLFLNLFVLVSCATDDYETALDKLSHVISFFQGKHLFTAENADADFPEEYVEKIIMDMFSMNFEQVNHLWGVLGGKYVPSMLYKLRLVPIQNAPTLPVEVIRALKEDTNGI